MKTFSNNVVRNVDDNDFLDYSKFFRTVGNYIYLAVSIVINKMVTG